MSFWKVRDIHFAYPRRREVLSGISFAVNPGETIALMGPNGSGKTTLGKLMMGMLQPSAGEVLLEGKNLKTYLLAEIGSKVGYIFQNPDRQIFTSSVYEEVRFGLSFRGWSASQQHEKVMEMLDYFELAHRKDYFPFNLSRGEKQRLAIASILALEPRFIIFDEPTTGLDGRRKEKFSRLLEKIRSTGVGYILISHDHGFSKENTQRVLKLHEGKIVESDACERSF